jgi:ribosomal protein L11 methyltransferase
LDEVQILGNNSFSVSYKLKNIAIENWNKKWESNFKPIIVNEICQVRAPFHKAKNIEYDIIIQPKMSFGTGHHETTRMMIKYILSNDFENKDVLDMGCGTSVLSILAEKRGAKKITAIDIDNWCYENSLENILQNSCKNITVMKGDVTLLVDKKFDIILANINRNILLSDINKYYTCLNSNGLLFLSGFYKKDIKLIEGKCSGLGLQLTENIFESDWVALKFTKIDGN